MAMAESSMDPDAVARDGGKGLMQFMDLTARDQHVADPMDPEEAIRGCASYMSQLYWRVRGVILDQGVGDVLLWRLAAVSWNCGYGYVRTALKKMQFDGKPMNWETFVQYLPDAEYNGKRAETKICLPHGLKVVPDASVLEE
jgi:membrane-bound lytic murein transglycosylase MltF